MTLRLHWFLPSHGDGRALVRRRLGGIPAGAAGSQRPPDIGYLAQVAGAAESVGFTSMLVPAGLFCEDPWLISAALAQRTSRIKFMVAFRPGLLSPTLAGQMAATLQRLSGNRLLLNVVVGGDADEQRRYGDWLEHDERYARADEFLDIMCAAWSGRVDRSGAHYRVAGALVTRPPERVPELFLGGSSHAARQVAVRHADVYLAWGEPPAAMAELGEEVRDLAGREGRRLRVGTRFNVIARDTAEEAWAEAGRLVDGIEPSEVAAAQERFSRTESEGQRRMARLHGGRLDRLEVYPNVWAGFGLVRPGAGAALVGSHDEVAERIEEYHRLGIDDVILSGQPHIEEAYWFGEGVVPLLHARGLLASGDDAARRTDPLAVTAR
jgi:alkanesulfonate monooxygenase